MLTIVLPNPGFHLPSSTTSERSLSKLTGIVIILRGMAEAAAEETRILVVDDEHYISDLVSMALKVAGFSVRSAANAPMGSTHRAAPFSMCPQPSRQR